MFGGAVAAASAAGTARALAFDDKVFDEAGGVKAESNPWAVFQFGYSAYKSGHKDQAAEAYRYAAENGQIGATWKLARMYAAGDGVTRDDYEAFKFFSEIVEQDVEPGSREESYVSDALVALAGYLKTGIPGSPVEANPIAAHEYYMRAAANYRNPSAQFEMGNMFLKGEGVKASVRQAGRWFQLAAEKGHAGAQATLGNLLFQSGKVVRGPRHDDGRPRTRFARRPALDPRHAGRSLLAGGRGRPPHGDRAGAGHTGQRQQQPVARYTAHSIGCVQSLFPLDPTPPLLSNGGASPLSLETGQT